jgi:hypothetical protein
MLAPLSEYLLLEQAHDQILILFLQSNPTRATACENAPPPEDCSLFLSLTQLFPPSGNPGRWTRSKQAARVSTIRLEKAG